jgi:hypothetical protein
MKHLLISLLLFTGFTSLAQLTDVTFQLDLTQAPSEIIAPEVNGEFNGWCGSCNPMTDENGDGIWEVTIPLAPGSYLWKFSSNNWEYQELPVGVNASSCFIFDGGGFVNRFLVVNPEDTLQTLPVYCWESCLFCGAIEGCTDPEANNWNPWANADDGSCILPPVDNCTEGYSPLLVTITPDTWSNFETGWNVLDTNTETILYESLPNSGTYSAGPGIPVQTLVCVPEGDVVIFEITDTYGDGLNGSTFGGLDGSCLVTICDSIVYATTPENIDFDYSDTVSFVVPSCFVVEEILGCTDNTFIEYNLEANIDDGSCITPIVLGCIDSTQFNYNPEANVEDKIEECDYTLTITDGVGDGWFGSWLGIKQGDWISPQYQLGPDDGLLSTFTLNLNSDEPVEAYFFSPTIQSQNTIEQCGFELVGPTGDIVIDVNQFFVIPYPNVYTGQPYCGNICESFIYGCLDSIAFNYVEEANTGDSSCYYNPGCTSPAFLEYHNQGFISDYDNESCQVLAEFGCMDTTQFNYNQYATVQWTSATDPTDPCISIVEGCMDPLALNFNPLANINDFDCIEPIYGCTDSTAFNYNELANVDNGSCIEVIEGCTDPTAFNYNLEANTEDFSCEEIVYGCTDPEAVNYDEEANTDNGSCQTVYANCIDPVIETYNLLNLENSCFAWVIDVSPSCCNSEWAGGCQELYNYCDENTVVNVEEFGETQIVVFPNPTQDIITIASNLSVNASLYNAMGQPVYQNSNVNQIDMSRYEAGIYHLILTYSNLQFTKKIVKQ